MAINYPIFDFPTLGIQSQLFYAGGMSAEGGFTSGGARVTTGPEPGGRAFLEMQVSLQVNEWNIPFASWLMTKAANGTIFRVPLVKTPQLVQDAALSSMLVPSGVQWEAVGMYAASPWDNSQNWSSDVVAPIAAIGLQGSVKMTINVSEIGNAIQYGHVVGVNDHSYLVEDIEYSDDGNTAVLTVNPPLRQDVTEDDYLMLRPYFLGTVTNIAEFRTSYERANMGHIKPGRLIFAETLL